MTTHKLNYDEWKTMDTPEICYFLGYLWADGNLSDRAFGFEIIESDFINIWPLLQKLGFKTFSTRLRNNSKNRQCGIHCGQRVFVDLLETLDFRNKSFESPHKILTKMSDSLKHYFYRGYVDGDGSICLSGKKKLIARIALNSSVSYDWSFLENLSKELDVKYCIERKIRKTKTHAYSVFTFCSKQSVLKFGNFIYNNFENDLIGLERKNQKFKLIQSLFLEQNKINIIKHNNALDRKYKSDIPSPIRILDDELFNLNGAV